MIYKTNLTKLQQSLSIAALLTALPLLITTPASAQDQSAQERGLAIATEAKVRDTGWGDSSASMIMVLKNKQGQESSRELRVKALELDNDGDKSLTVFDKPLDVKGTSFLSFSHIDTPDDQWLFLPALKRVKRISSRNKSGPFMGSEFAFEDLSSFEVDKYSYTYLNDETIDGMELYVIEQIPNDEFSGYTKRVAWLDKVHYRPFKIDFYDRKGSLLKTLTFSRYQQYLGKFWRAEESTMINHQSGKSTLLSYSDYKFNIGLKDSDFNKNTLKRAR
ncbi:outer membrane lipoprotein-sorting protein [Arenicella sp. 4NH20-0111]|uniref:outer membrane lipoprotein-sorting protein n=1 Tax=Arenicella sp. 4NH20-0111 TaxID=3127648 RepID=UPI00310C1F77